jgi:hypothetical protein
MIHAGLRYAFSPIPSCLDKTAFILVPSGHSGLTFTQRHNGCVTEGGKPRARRCRVGAGERGRDLGAEGVSIYMSIYRWCDSGLPDY